MTIKRTVTLRALRGHAMWLVAAPLVGILVAWLLMVGPAEADHGGQPHSGRVVVGAIAGADVLLPSSAIEPSSPPNAALDGPVAGSSSLALAVSLAFIIAVLFAVSRGARRVRRLPVAAFRRYIDIDL